MSEEKDETRARRNGGATQVAAGNDSAEDLARAFEQWQREVLIPLLAKHPEREKRFTTSSGIAIKSDGNATGYQVTASHTASGNTFWVTVGEGGSVEGKIQKAP